jgi:hypothetical protein
MVEIRQSESRFDRKSSANRIFGHLARWYSFTLASSPVEIDEKLRRNRRQHRRFNR